MGIWGANEWTDNMFKKYWWLVVLMVIGYMAYHIFAG